MKVMKINSRESIGIVLPIYLKKHFGYTIGTKLKLTILQNNSLLIEKDQIKDSKDIIKEHNKLMDKLDEFENKLKQK